MIDKTTIFFFMVQFELSLVGFQNLFCSVNPYHFLRHHLRGDFFNHITACTGGNRNLSRVQGHVSALDAFGGERVMPPYFERVQPRQ